MSDIIGRHAVESENNSESRHSMDYPAGQSSAGNSAVHPGSNGREDDSSSLSTARSLKTADGRRRSGFSTSSRSLYSISEGHITKCLFNEGPGMVINLDLHEYVVRKTSSLKNA